MFNVVHRTIVGGSRGAVTWTAYKSEVDYNEWNNEKMKSWYEEVAKGVTSNQAVYLCSLPKATIDVMVSQMKHFNEKLQTALKMPEG